MKSTKRRRAHRRGQLAELVCLWHLRCRGYRILARRYRVPAGEIDLIVRRGRVLAAIEVKARADWTSAAESILGRQRRRIARALEQFRRARPELAPLDSRFDVMLVIPGRLPRHMPDAWRADP